MNVKLMLAIMALVLMTPLVAFAHLNEASGIVRRVVDGCTFKVDGFGTVRLADLGCPPMGTANGVHSREYSMERLLNVQVFLDVDNNTGNGCVVYLQGKNGNPKLAPCYNRMMMMMMMMMMDAGYAWVSDDTNNEFNPHDWWNVAN